MPRFQSSIRQLVEFECDRCAHNQFASHRFLSSTRKAPDARKARDCASREHRRSQLSKRCCPRETQHSGWLGSRYQRVLQPGHTGFRTIS